MRAGKSRTRIGFALLLALLVPAVLAPQARRSTPAQKRAASAPAPLRFEISFPVEMSATPLDGRLLLLVSTDGAAEPRFQIRSNAETQQMFGIDVESLAPGAATVIDASALGYPVESISQIPPGEYFVQALLNIYTNFQRDDGHTVELPMDQGEGQQWNRKPGNLYSTPQKVRIDPIVGGTIRISRFLPFLTAGGETGQARESRGRAAGSRRTIERELR